MAFAEAMSRNRSESASTRPRGRRRRAVLVGLVLGVALDLALVAAPVPARGDTAAGRWDWPVAPPQLLVRGYESPSTRYGAGHRGIDIEALPGTAVLAPDDGVVSLAGWVVDRPVLAIRHSGGIVSSFEPVEASVSAGDPVVRGQPVGAVAEPSSAESVDAQSAHCVGCLHLGARHDGDYFSPLALLEGIPRAVLLPLDP
jgi:murein DD-endopeptidase MepM/ murein hydrolase activator NlpD